MHTEKAKARVRTAAKPAKVRSLGELRNKDTISLLETLLAQSKSGKVTGLIVCASEQGGQSYSMAVSGDYARNPMMALSANSRIGHRLNVLADSQQSAPPASAGS